MSPGAVRIRHDDWLVELDADQGGQIVRADWQGRNVLAPGVAGRSAAEQHAGCFPLVPYSNRIRGGRFQFEGRDVHLPPPDYAPPHALHGLGWRSAWTVTETAPDGARMRYEHAAGAWPWHYSAEQHIRTNANRLLVTLTLTNLDTSSMPAGIGLHPYFARPADLSLAAHVAGRWETAPGEPGLPVRRTAAPADLGAAGLDHCFHGWDGRAGISGRGHPTIELDASPSLGNLVIYTPPGKAYFCAEPVSHVNDALNLSGLPEAEGMAVLVPGETLSGTMTLKVSLA